MEKKSSFIVRYFVAIAIFVGGLVLTILGILSYKPTWVKTNALVTHVDQKVQSGKTYMIPYVSYDVKDTHYDEIMLDVYISSVTEKGANVPIRYNPNNPKEITYYLGNIFTDWAFSAGLIFVGVSGCIATYQIIKGRLMKKKALLETPQVENIPPLKITAKEKDLEDDKKEE